MPEALCRWPNISPGSKLCYGRLARYGGEDSECYPSMKALARELGICSRHCRRYIRELEANRLIRRASRYRDGAQTSNRFEFVWHEVFQDDGRNDQSLADGPVMDGMTALSDKESHLKESHVKKPQDIDCSTTNRTNHDSPSSGPVPSEIKRYSNLRKVLCEYFREEGQEDIYPSDRTVVDVMDAAGGATEREVIDCLTYLYYDRGLKPGTRNGPRHWAWFKTTVADYFNRKREREQAANPDGYDEWLDRNNCRLTPEQFEGMTGVIDIDGS